MSAPVVEPGEPLAWGAQDSPALYGVLGAVFHLEILRPSDEPRLEKAMRLVYDWLGSRLRWTRRSCDSWVSPFRPADLEYVFCYVRDLDEPKVADPDARLFTANLGKIGVMDYEVSCNGADDDSDASPYLLRFCAEIPEVRRGDLYEPYAVLVLTVPSTWPIADFHARVTAIAAELRLRWGAAGLTYASWDLQDLEVSNQKLYAHARRHPGYDVGYFHADMERWHDQVRSVSWLTFLGKDLARRLEDAGKNVTSGSLLHVTEVGESLCVQAGAAPEEGDVNRLGYPRAYVEADALIRPIRAADGKPFVFLGRWTESAVTDWIRRFERRLW